MNSPEQRIDEALEKVLRAAGTSLKHYSTARTIEKMRAAMREIIVDAYTRGTDDCFKAMTEAASDEAWNIASELDKSKQALANVRAFLASDNLACTYQTLGQYRTAAIRLIDVAG